LFFFNSGASHRVVAKEKKNDDSLCLFIFIKQADKQVASAASFEKKKLI
jgi:hypothetical protein